MIDAVLFDWGNTLARTEWSDDVARRGNELGLAAIGRAALPAPAAVRAWWRTYLSAPQQEDSPDELDIVYLTAECFRSLGCPLAPDELERYIDATQRYWVSASTVHADTHTVLDELRRRGLRLAVVSNSTTPTRFLDGSLREQGLAERVDAWVFSREVGKRKPHPAIFDAALGALGVEARRAVFVGDRGYEDIRGAREVGMTTVQAGWFGAVDDPRGAEPDFRAAEPLDVLEIVARFRRRAA